MRTVLPRWWCLVFGLASALAGVAGPARAQTDTALALEAGPHANEPPGFQPISVRTFRERAEAGWETRRGPQFQIVQDPTAPVSPPYVGQSNFAMGYEGGSGPTDTWLDLGAGYDQLYISCWIKMSPNFQGAPSNGINKIFHLWMGDKSTVVFAALGRGMGPLVPQMRLQNVQMRNRGVSFNIDPRGFGQIGRGQWHHVEIYLRMNRPGWTDGVVRWWLDGRMVGSDQAVGFRRFGSDSHWSRVSWNPTWGAPRDRVRNPMFIEMDHIYVSGLRN